MISLAETAPTKRSPAKPKPVPKLKPAQLAGAQERVRPQPQLDPSAVARANRALSARDDDGGANSPRSTGALPGLRVLPPPPPPQSAPSSSHADNAAQPRELQTPRISSGRGGGDCHPTEGDALPPTASSAMSPTRQLSCTPATFSASGLSAPPSALGSSLSTTASSASAPKASARRGSVGDEEFTRHFSSGAAAESAQAAGSAAVASTAAELQEWMAEAAAAASHLPKGQQVKLESILQERAKLLSRFFEEQLKKQYEAMRREVNRLGKQHQRDVQALDQRFKQKMVGLAQRFKVLEAEEAKMALVRTQNTELQEELVRRDQARLELESKIRDLKQQLGGREAQVQELKGQIGQQAEREQQLLGTIDEREQNIAQADKLLESTKAELYAQLAQKRDELGALHLQLHSAKASYESEVQRKQDDIRELEGAMSKLQEYTGKMNGYVGQVQSQIKKREADMRTQLALMKNTIAFALYIDETLAVDLMDPHTTSIFLRPVLVLPSGVTYSQSTVDKIMADAKAAGKEPVCPQSGTAITSISPNHVVDSILSRYLFKQQITRDVVDSLKQFQEASADEDQPLEAYMQQMKENMVERLQVVHTDEMSRMAKEYEAKLEAFSLEKQAADKRAVEAADELSKLSSKSQEVKGANAEEITRLDTLLRQTQNCLDESSKERDELRQKRRDLEQRLYVAQEQLAKFEEELEDDADALDAGPSNAKLARLRKTDMLSMQMELATAKQQLADATERSEELASEAEMQDREMSQIRQQLAAEKKLNQSLGEEMRQLSSKVHGLTKEKAELVENLSAVDRRAKATQAKLDMYVKRAAEVKRTLAEKELQLDTLQDDVQKLRARFEEKSAAARDQAADVAELQLRLDETASDLTRKERHLTITRQQLSEAKQAEAEATQRAEWLTSEVDRQAGLVERRHRDLKGTQAALAEAQAEVKRLQMRLDHVGLKEAEEGMRMTTLEDAYTQAGVYRPVAHMPNVPVIDDMLSTLTVANKHLTEVATTKLQAMANAPVIDFTRGRQFGGPASPPNGDGPKKVGASESELENQSAAALQDAVAPALEAEALEQQPVIDPYVPIKEMLPTASQSQSQLA